MGKSLLYRWFGLRKVPADTRRRLASEGIVIDEEGTSCALAYRNFRGPRNAFKRGFESGAVGTLVISRQSFYIQFPYMLVCDRPIEDAVRHVALQLDGASRLIMEYGVEELFDGASGQLTCTWRTDNAAAIESHIRSLQQNLG